MDYCASKNQIKSYAPTATGSTLFAKNIDCVTLDADYIGCSTLTINGQSITGITNVTNKTQNILDTTTANQTIMQGSLNVSDIETTRITAIDSTGLQVQSPVTQSISSSTGGLTLSLVNPTLGTATTNYMGLLMGTSATGSSRGWQMLYYNTNLAGSTNNRLEFKMAGYSTPTMSMIQGKVGIANAAPTEALDVTGNAKVNGTLAVTGVITGTLSNTLLGTGTSSAGPSNTWRQWSFVNPPFEAWFSFRELTCVNFVPNSDIYILQFITSTGAAVIFDYGFTYGTNANGGELWASGEMPIWNTPFTTSAGANARFAGQIRISRISSTSSDVSYAVNGMSTRADAQPTTGYLTNYIGLLRLVSGATLTGLRIACKAGIGGTSRNSVDCTGNLSYTR